MRTSYQKDRREFLRNAGAIGAVAAFLPQTLHSFPKKKLKVLVLGGTNFLGPAVVNAFIANGHDVTLFNRGITNPHLYPQLRKIRGDREAGITGYDDLAAANENWDVVIDVWPQNPNLVRDATSILETKTNHYIYVSSIAVYRNYVNPGMDESSPLLEVVDYEEGNYSGNKVLSEEIVKEVFPTSHTIIRPGAIVGDRDPGPFGIHLLKRIATQNEILAPDSNDPTQIIDSVDIGQFLRLCAENGTTGIYNLTGPGKTLGFKDLITRSKAALKSDVRITWVDPIWLMEEMNIQPFSDIPFWIPIKNDPEPGFYQISNQKAIDRGLSFTKLEKTVKRSYESVTKNRYIPEGDSEDYFGINPEKEKEVIEAWKAR